MRAQSLRQLALLTPIESLGVKNYPQFSNSLEGLIELTESYYTHSSGLLQGKDTDQQQPEEKMHREESGRIPNVKLLLFSGHFTLPILMHDNIHGPLPIKKVFLSNSIQFLLLLHYVGMTD